MKTFMVVVAYGCLLACGGMLFMHRFLECLVFFAGAALFTWISGKDWSDSF